MKQPIMTALVLPVLITITVIPKYSAAVTVVTELTKCSRFTTDARCGYFKDTINAEHNNANSLPYNTEESCCGRNGGICDNQACWLGGACVANDTGHDSYSLCQDVCGAMGYDVFVFAANSDGTYYWACACSYATEWRAYKTGVLRKYTRKNMGTCVDVALDVYKCASGYYGTAPNNCIVCPANATCSDGTSFYCRDGYYKNSAKNGCIKCPDSKAGGLGWDASGNGVAGEYGYEDITDCFIPEGTVLHDSTGTFELINSDCNWVK